MTFLSLAHFTIIDADPLTLIEAGRAGGFDGVGLRLVAPVGADPVSDLAGDAMLRRRVRERLDATGITLFDRTGYRLKLTERGRAVFDRVRVLLADHRALATYARHLARGQEPELRVVIGDLTPLPATLALLRQHFAEYPQTRLHLQFEAITGPWERLAASDADLIIHHVDAGDSRFETTPLQKVELIPVAAPGFFPVCPADLTPEHLRAVTQCVIRESSSGESTRSYYLVEGAQTCTVSDQMMKREVILQGLGWGHMPDFMVTRDLEDGTLVPVSGPLLRGRTVDIVAARLRGTTHRPVATALWARLRSLPSLGASNRTRGRTS